MLFGNLSPLAPKGIASGEAQAISHRQHIADVDQLVGDHAEPDPSLHPFGAAISASPQVRAAA